MKTRILLINTPQENVLPAGIEDDFIDIIGYYPPLGLMYIASMLKNNGYDVKILDCVPMNIGYNEIKDIVREYNPFVVGISTYTMSMVDVLETARIVKEVNPEIYTVLGGHHTLLYPRQSAKYPNVDFILIGEADYTFSQLVELLENKVSYDELLEVPGIGFYRDGKERINYKREIIQNLDDLPIPDRNLLPKELYKSAVGRNKMVATVMSSRGCPFKCTYCYTPSKKYRSRSTQNIIEEVKYLISLGYKEIFFFDDLFALQPQKVIDFAQALVRENIKIDWSFRGRINTVTKEMIDEAAKAGIHRIQFGIESGVDKTLIRVRKGITTEQTKKVIKWCKEAKITTIGNFMIGLPDETEQDINQTLIFSRKIGLNYAQYSILVPYPFTAIYEEGLQKGVFSKDYWLEFAENPYKVKPEFKVEYWTENVSEEYLFETIKKSFKRFYFRPITVKNKLKEIKTWNEFFYAVKGALSVFKFNPKIKKEPEM